MLCFVFLKENFTESYKELKQISLEELRLDPTQQTKAPKLVSAPHAMPYLNKLKLHLMTSSITLH